MKIFIRDRQTVEKGQKYRKKIFLQNPLKNPYPYPPITRHRFFAVFTQGKFRFRVSLANGFWPGWTPYYGVDFYQGQKVPPCRSSSINPTKNPKAKLPCNFSPLQDGFHPSRICLEGILVLTNSTWVKTKLRGWFLPRPKRQGKTTLLYKLD